ncbi:hypothetical protein ACSLBF_20765 (plasmid) [Pseudoalteromonas sp. T1lg65]|uniref:hypothetical protein n=1 Tax=Pseudoalteromonas sp. T1lg65 TaxID=2077101 RepID=UPI003F7B18A0
MNLKSVIFGTFAALTISAMATPVAAQQEVASYLTPAKGTYTYRVVCTDRQTGTVIFNRIVYDLVLADHLVMFCTEFDGQGVILSI